MHGKPRIIGVLFLIILLLGVSGCLGGDSSNAGTSSPDLGTTSTGSSQVTTTTRTPQYVEKVMASDTITLPDSSSDESYQEIYFAVDKDNAKIKIEISPRPYPVNVVVLTRSEYEKALANYNYDPEFLYLKEEFEGGTINLNLDPGEYVLVIGYSPDRYMEKQEISLNSGTLVIKAGKYATVPIVLQSYYPELKDKVVDDWYNIDLELSIREELDINVYLMDETEYAVWTQGGEAKALDVIKKAKSGSYTFYGLELDQRYILVFDNGYSLITTKTIDYSITAGVAVADKNTVTVKITEGYYE